MQGVVSLDTSTALGLWRTLRGGAEAMADD